MGVLARFLEVVDDIGLRKYGEDRVGSLGTFSRTRNQSRPAFVAYQLSILLDLKICAFSFCVLLVR